LKLSVFYDHVIEASEQTGKSITEILANVRNCGIEALEIRLSHLQESRDVIEQIKEVGLGISCIFEFYDMGIRDETKKIRQHLNMAKELQAPNIMIVPGFLHGDDVNRLKSVMQEKTLLTAFFDSHQEVKRMAEGINMAVDMGKKLGIKVLFEDFDDFSSPMSGKNGVDWFLEKCPEVGYALDCGNFIMYDEDVLDAFEKFSARICHVHCKDRAKEVVAVGEGRIPIKEVVSTLLESGYNGYFAIEHFDAKNQMDCIKKSACYLRSISIK